MDDTSGAERARGIVGVLRDHGYQAWLVGGCVRDELLGIVPKDYDVATDATPTGIERLFPHAEKIGAHFGVMLVDRVEVATFRSDHSYSDGRHPDAVTFETDPRRDALRRDFTINAMFRDPFDGTVLDFVNGRQDLRDGVVRAIGDPVQRFTEDHLRMMRAVRFAARFGFQIEPRTFEAMRELRSLIRLVAAERVREELLRILTEGGARRGMELLDGCGLLAEILPEAKAMQGVEQPPQYHPEGDVWTHVMIMLEQMGKAPSTLALGVLLHDIAKPPTFRVTDRIRFDGHVELGVEMSKAILSRLRCSGETTDRVCSLVANHMKFMHVQQMKQSTLKRFLRTPHFQEHLALHRLDCGSSNRRFDNYEFAKNLFEKLPEEELRPPRLLTGDDLIAAGLEAGPSFAKILRIVEDAQLEGRIHSKEEALEMALQLRSEDGTPPPRES